MPVNLSLPLVDFLAEHHCGSPQAPICGDRTHAANGRGPQLFDKLPLESAVFLEVSSLVTLSTPGVVADSNGLFHGLGDHAENSFSVDGQPITDQQSKVFSNQIPVGCYSIDGGDRGRPHRPSTEVRLA